MLIKADFNLTKTDPKGAYPGQLAWMLIKIASSSVAGKKSTPLPDV